MSLGTRQNLYAEESKNELFNHARKMECLNEFMFLLESHRFMRQVAQFMFTLALTMTGFPTPSVYTNRQKMTLETRFWPVEAQSVITMESGKLEKYLLREQLAN